MSPFVNYQLCTCADETGSFYNVYLVSPFIALAALLFSLSLWLCHILILTASVGADIGINSHWIQIQEYLSVSLKLQPIFNDNKSHRRFHDSLFVSIKYLSFVYFTHFTFFSVPGNSGEHCTSGLRDKIQ